MTIESNIVSSTTAGSVHCLKKTRSIIRDADYDTGSICFITEYGTIVSLGFYGNIDLKASRIIEAENKWYSDVIGTSDASATVASADLAMSSFLQASNAQGYLWAASTNQMKGIFSYYPYLKGYAAGLNNAGA